MGFWSVVGGYLFLSLALICVLGYFAYRNRGTFCRWMDRHEIQPSRVTGWLQAIGGGVVAVFSVTLPDSMSAIQLLNAFLGAMFVGFGIENLRNPPSVEYRPRWYVGEGHPDWLAGKEKPKRTPQLSQFSIFVAVTVFGVAFAIFGSRLKVQREAYHKHKQAERTVKKLGGGVQYWTLNLDGTAVTDKDLETIAHFQGIRGLNLGSTGITNSGLKSLAQMKGLQKVNLSGTRVDDDGVDDLLKIKTKSIDVSNTGLSGSAVERLSKRRGLEVLH